MSNRVQLHPIWQICLKPAAYSLFARRHYNTQQIFDPSIHALLPIMFLPSDIAVGFILFAIESGAFACSDLPIGLHSAFCASDVPLFCTNSSSLWPGKLSRIHSLTDSRALCLLPFIHNRCALWKWFSSCHKQHHNGNCKYFFHEFWCLTSLTSEQREGLIASRRNLRKLFLLWKPNNKFATLPLLRCEFDFSF